MAPLLTTTPSSGGYTQSGNGREGGIFGLEDYQETKALLFNIKEALRIAVKRS
jgi:acyl-CoA reductase-like NAD-dependent aldehyde dehydrogenase